MRTSFRIIFQNSPIFVSQEIQNNPDCEEAKKCKASSFLYNAEGQALTWGENGMYFHLRHPFPKLPATEFNCQIITRSTFYSLNCNWGYLLSVLWMCCIFWEGLKALTVLPNQTRILSSASQQACVTCTNIGTPPAPRRPQKWADTEAWWVCFESLLPLQPYLGCREAHQQCRCAAVGAAKRKRPFPT